MGVFHGAGVAGSSVGTATDWHPQQPRLIYQFNAAPEIVHGFYEANSQSFKAGALVYLNSGAVTAFPTGDVPLAGIAMKAATNVTTGNIEIPIMKAIPGSEWWINVTDGSGVFEAANTTASLQTAYDVEVTNGICTLASDDTTNPVFRIQQWVYDETGTITTLAKVILLDAECMWLSGA